MTNRFGDSHSAAIFPSARHRKAARHRVLASASTAILGLAAMLAGGLWAAATPVPQESPSEDFANTIAGYQVPDTAPVEQLVAGLEGEDVATDAVASLAQFFATAPETDQAVTGPLGFSDWSQPEAMGVSDPSQEVREVEVFFEAVEHGGAPVVFEIMGAGGTEYSFNPTDPAPDPDSAPDPDPDPAPDPDPEPEPEPDTDPLFQIEYRDGDAVNLFTFNEDTREAWSITEDGSTTTLHPFLAGFLYSVWEKAGADDEYLVVESTELFDDGLVLDNTIPETPMGFEM